MRVYASIYNIISCALVRKFNINNRMYIYTYRIILAPPIQPIQPILLHVTACYNNSSANDEALSFLLSVSIFTREWDGKKTELFSMFEPELCPEP